MGRSNKRMTMVAFAFALGCAACGETDADEPFGFPAPATTGVPAGSSGEDEPGDTGVGDGSSGDADEGSSDSGTAQPPPHGCELTPTDSPVLAGEFFVSPADPHPGDTVTVIVRATNGLGRGDAPPMDLQVDGGNGVQMVDLQTIQGGDALYYYAVPDVALGDLCLLSSIDGAPEASAKLTVTPRPPGPDASAGVYKVVENHQWTCDEQPGFGNELDVYVRDGAGKPVPGAIVDVAMADTSDPETVYNGDAESLLTQIVTNEQGYAKVYNYWPITEHGLLVFELSVRGAASDVATEITTGWWEDDNMGCSYCGTPTVNVWGHWSYTVTFELDPNATEACVVPNDHAGMSACGDPIHIHHDPIVEACWSVP